MFAFWDYSNGAKIHFDVLFVEYSLSFHQVVRIIHVTGLERFSSIVKLNRKRHTVLPLFLFCLSIRTWKNRVD